MCQVLLKPKQSPVLLEFTFWPVQKGANGPTRERVAEDEVWKNMGNLQSHIGHSWLLLRVKRGVTAKL